MSDEPLSPFPPDVPDADVLDGVLAGEASLDERTRLHQWLTAHPPAAGVIREFLNEAAGEGTPGQRSAEETFAVLSRRLSVSTADTSTSAATEVQHPATSLRHRTARGTISFPRPVWYTLAGVAMGALAVVVGRRDSVVSTDNRVAASILTYTTANGQRANITLPDGSTVALNVASRLDVPADYAMGNRALRLSGEALFTVQHLDGAPLTVTTAGTTARVLGTSFTVRHYATDSTVRVAVRDGKVAVRSAVLTAAQQVDVGTAGTLHVGPADPAQFSFAKGTLVFAGRTLVSAVPELNRWYDADVRLGDARLAHRQITVEFAAGSLADLAAILELTFDIRVARDGRVLTLYSR